MTLNVVNMYKNKCQIKNCDRCVSEKNKKSNWAEAKLLDCDFNFLGYLVVAAVTFICYCCFVFAFFG